MAIIRAGKPITRSEMRRTIMAANNWNAEQYRKQYDIFKNKLRFYESIQRSRGIDVETQSPQEVLYKAARAKQRFGADYEPSQEMQQIQAVTAHSISKGRQIAKQPTSKAYKAAVAKVVNIRFSGFIDFYNTAQYIVYGKPLTSQSDDGAIADALDFYGLEPCRLEMIGNEYFNIETGEALYEIMGGKEMKPITDPIAQEEALKAFATYLHEKQPRTGKDKGAPSSKGVGGFAQGETYGSGDEDDGSEFDFSEWL